MLKIKRALRSDRVMKALTGQTKAEFERLLPKFSASLKKTQAEARKNGNELWVADIDILRDTRRQAVLYSVLPEMLSDL